MTDENVTLSRRKVLGAASAIGGAAALGGSGTMAFFSDEETFANNQLVTGSLDLKVAWQEHYSDWLGAEENFARMPGPGESPDFRLPAAHGGGRAIELIFEDPPGDDGGTDSRPGESDGGRQFLRNTVEEAANGGIFGDNDLCGTGADVPERPLIELSDVKPGDFGFSLFRLQLCDNPGFLWLGGGLEAASENGLTEPEKKDADEDGDPAATNPALVELLDEIQVAVGVGTTNDLAAAPPDNLFPTPDPSSSVPQPAYQVSLREFLGLAGKGKGIPLPGDTPAGEGGGSGRPCFAGETSHYVSVVWWLPVDHANEIQTDEVTFDLGFYAEQCRHNAVADRYVAGGESLQDAIDAAAPGETIEVGPGQFGPVVVGTPGLTLRSVGSRARIEQPATGNSTAVSIEADDVTFEGFEVTNPDGLIGIGVGSGYDGVTIRCNHVHDVGPTGSLGVTGINLRPGSSRSGISITDNRIESLVQTFTGSGFPTLNGILVDASDPAAETLSGSTIARNTITDLESDIAPLGIVLQPNAVDVSIADNLISDLLAANSVGSYTGTTFAQGLSIDSPSTTGFDITGNTIKEVVSEDGFFAEDIKIEPTVDVGGIDVSGNNLLSAIGLNNANGANPTITAENNYWGSSGGPFEIVNNDDDGDVPPSGGGGEVDLETVTASAVTENVDYDPFATGSQ